MKSYTSIHDPKDLLTYEFLTKSLGVKKYDETATYSKGALVYHEDATDTYLDSIFEANQDIATAESWTAAHWDTVDLETIIKRSMHKYEPYMEVIDGASTQEVVHMDKAVVFYSDNQFYLGIAEFDSDTWDFTGNHKWYGDGSLEYSTNGKDWNDWCDSTTTAVTSQASALSSYGDYRLYVRGKGGTKTGPDAATELLYSVFTSKDDAAGTNDVPFNVMGKFDWLLNYESNSVECGNCTCLFWSAPVVDASGLVMSKKLNTDGYNYSNMFESCALLTTPPQLPATQLTESCYGLMFCECSSLTTAPELPATTLAESCYYDMFDSCTSLVFPPTLPAITLVEGCYTDMFWGCSSLAVAPILPATIMAADCYSLMFANCTSLTTPPTLPATQLAESCYDSMFKSCKSLKTAPELPATTLFKRCYSYMFEECTSLEVTPELPAGILDVECYGKMFNGCDLLTEIKPILAKEVKASSCYQMFYNCKSLTLAPDLLIEKIEGGDGSTPETQGGCREMFSHCTSLVKAPNLSSLVEVGEEGCMQMFSGCASLVAAPELPATTIAKDCYNSTFLNCSSLIIPCEFPATGNLPQHCYERMFYGCNIEFTNDTSATPCRIPTTGTVIDTGTGAASAAVGMFANNQGPLPGTETGGSGPGNPQVNHTYYYVTPAPGEDPAGTFTFYNLEHKYPKNDVVITNTLHSTSSIEYSIDGGSTWTVLTNGASTPAAGEVKIRGTLVTVDPSDPDVTYPLTITGTRVAVKGQLEDNKNYRSLFNGCTALVDASGLRGATTLAEDCYRDMFSGCSSLIAPPTLPATQLADACYYGMFCSCAALTTAPELPATNLANSCYAGMFWQCTGLEAAPELPATTLAELCYSGMFIACTSLTTPPALPAETLADNCYSNMFSNCTSLIEPPEELPAEQLAEYCYSYMFSGCISLIYAPTILARTLADYCCENMFYGCTALLYPGSGLDLLAEEMKTECYQQMFARCTSLTETPCIYATTAADSCFERMFEGCTSLTMVNGGLVMDLTTAAEECCKEMFKGCISLSSVDPGLLANVATLDASSFASMFEDCTLFNTTLELPAENLVISCYSRMFYNCKSLTIPPALPATTLAESCYQDMFNGCAHIRKCPELPVTTLANFCYMRMFANCVSLTEPCALPAITLISSCYKEMFSGCTGIEFASSGTAYRIPTTGTSTTLASDNVTNMFANCSGTLPGSEKTTPTPGTPQINTTYYIKKAGDMNKYEPYIEYDGTSAKEVVHMDKCVIFTSSNAFILQLTGNKWYGEGTLEYSTDKKTWTQYANDGTATFPAPVQQTNGKYELYLRGKGNTHTFDGTNATQFTSAAADRFDIIGNFDWLLDCTSLNVLCGECDNLFDSTGVVDASGLVMSKNFKTSETLQYYELFRDCKSLMHAPQLPATTLTNYCYQKMFYSCEALTTPPVLPATTLTNGCYETMFANCIGLITPPILLATALADSCCSGMFSCCDSLATTPTFLAKTLGNRCCYCMFENCISLTTASKLPATTLAPECYSSMFNSCKSLTTAPELPATTLANGCYSSMFSGCEALITPPQLPATTLAVECYNGMFYQCASLITPPALPATTLTNSCYEWMFSGCTSLTAPCELPATTMAESCYHYMFQECSGITWTTDASATPYRLPSSGTGTAATDWNVDMFLDNSGTLPGSETGGAGAGTPSIDTTYYYVTPEEPEEFVRKGKEYMEVISGTAPITGFTVDANGVLSFTRSSIEYVTHIDKSVIFTSPNTFNLQLSGNAWHGDGTLEYSTDGHTWETYGTTNATTLPAPKLQDNGKYELYLRGKGNTYTSDETDYTQFTTNSADRINIIGKFDYLLDYSSTPTVKSVQYLFYETNIVDASELILPMNFGETNDGNCLYLFSQCKYLTGVPQLPATTLATGCYADMFEGCTSLTVVPTLSATQLAIGCYAGMFQGCTALTAAPALPATSLAIACYSGMFLGCEALTTAPELPATTLANNCYQRMFIDCTALTAAPALPATTLANNCYQRMFENCTGITKIPALPATNIPSNAYNVMFGSCTGLKFYPVGSTTSESFTIPSTTTVGTNALANMFQYCTDFPETGGTPVPGTVYGYGDKLPDPYITIESTDSSLFFVIMSTTSTEVGLPNIEWSTDGVTWSAPAAMPGKIAFPVSGGPIPTTKVYVRGNGFTHFCDDTGYTTFTFMGAGGPITNSVIKISGELRYLYDQSGETTCGNASGLFEPVDTDGAGNYQAVISDVSELVFPTKLGTNDYGLFSYMFYNYSGNNSQPIETPPQLPATTLTPNCYRNMFYGCDSLKTPCELPATTLADYCYYQMFFSCSALETAPELPATTLADYCYYSMFCYCSSLTTPPALPATTLADYCYNYMFYGCGFTSAPTLPALTVPSGAYVGMFSDCTSLTTPPELPATTIEIDNTLIYDNDGDGYEWMFYGCTSLTTIPTMPASITINRTGTYTKDTSPLAFYQMIEAEEDEPYNPSLDFSKSDKSWICPTITDGSGAANLSNMFQGQTNADDDHGFADGNGTAVAGHTYTYGSV